MHLMTYRLQASPAPRNSVLFRRSRRKNRFRGPDCDLNHFQSYRHPDAPASQKDQAGPGIDNRLAFRHGHRCRGEVYYLFQYSNLAAQLSFKKRPDIGSTHYLRKPYSSLKNWGFKLAMGFWSFASSSPGPWTSRRVISAIFRASWSNGPTFSR